MDQTYLAEPGFTAAGGVILLTE